MNAERFKRLHELFENAERLSPGDREQFVRQLTQEDEELRNELEAMLGYDDNELDAVLQPPAMQGMDDSPSHVEDATEPISRSSAVIPKIEGYRILGVLGQGGMGIVYRAVQIKLNREVALKVLPAVVGSANPAAVERFRNEATAAARLHHTNIVPIHDFGESSDAYYYAMELVEGRTLDDVIRHLDSQRADQASPLRLAEIVHRSTRQPSDDLEKRGVPSNSHSDSRERGSSGSASRLVATTTGRGKPYHRQVALWIADVAEALHYAHDAGIIHRDVKPSNLILSVDGRIMITDFGLAKNRGERSVTVTGNMLGTLRYMSPEQAMAKRVRLDHRTDVYSLGVTMYELLTFHAAFPGDDDKQVLGNIIAREPVSPRKIAPHLPVELETICQKMIEKHPEARYPTARAVSEDLRRYLSDMPIEARRAGVTKRTVKFLKRHKTMSVTAAALLVVGGLILMAAQLSRNLQETKFDADRAKSDLSRTQHEAEADQLINRWLEAIRLGDHDAASKHLHKLEQLGIDPYFVTSNRALSRKQQYIETGDRQWLHLAEESARNATISDPRKPGAHNLYGVILYLQALESDNPSKRETRLAHALTECNLAIDSGFSPDDNEKRLSADWQRATAHANRARVLALMQRISEARDSAELAVNQAMSLEKRSYYNPSGALRTYGTILLHLGDGRAIDYLEQAHSAQDGDPATLAWIAKYYLSIGSDTDVAEWRARSAYDWFVRQGKVVDPRIRSVYALASLRSAKFGAAIEQAQQAVADGGNVASNQLICAVAHARSGRKNEAREAMRAADKAWPDEFICAESGNPACCGYRVTCENEILWFDEAADLCNLRDEAVAVLGGG